MNEQSLPAEYFVICRGQWDPTASRDEIKTAIDPTSQAKVVSAEAFLEGCHLIPTLHKNRP